MVMGSLLLTLALSGEAQGLAIADFDGPNPLSGWAFSRDGATGSLALGQGHIGQGAVLEYRFACRGASLCGAVAAVWKPAKPLKVKRRGALALWVRAAPEVKLTLLVTDKSEGRKRYPFEVATLENARGNWRRISIPLAAKSTGYGDEDHAGAPEGRITAIGILAEARYPRLMSSMLSGSVEFDDLRLLESADQPFELKPGAKLVPAPDGAGQLAPRLGVNIHSLADTVALDLAQKAGFRFVRADLLWRQAERSGAYRFFAYDRLLSALEARGMSALWILDYGHPQHGGERPRSPDDVAAFARYAAAVAAHFKGRRVRYEIWNEPDTERFWPPSPNPGDYGVLLRQAAAAIRQADPDAKVASGGVSRIDLPFLEAVFSEGGAAQVNAVGVHPYRRAGPETLAAELPLLRGIITRALGDQVEIWDTEWGYASYDYFSKNLSGDGHSAAGRKRQAVLACREALTVWALNLPLAVWYDLRDDGEEARNPEHNYGLLDSGGATKPAMEALTGLARLAASRNFAGRIADVPHGVHVMRLDGADHVFVVWNEQPDASIMVRLPLDGFVAATNLAGEPLNLRPDRHGNGEIALPETEGPIYLTLRSGR